MEFVDTKSKVKESKKLKKYYLDRAKEQKNIEYEGTGDTSYSQRNNTKIARKKYWLIGET